MLLGISPELIFSRWLLNLTATPKEPSLHGLPFFLVCLALSPFKLKHSPTRPSPTLRTLYPWVVQTVILGATSNHSRKPPKPLNKKGDRLFKQNDG